MGVQRRLLLALCVFFWSMAVVRPSPTELSLAARLQADQTDCWASLVELKACTGEVILFFLNGETYLGPSCCWAIRVIERDCWPAMLLTLGFTSQEGDILQDYCDDAPTSPGPPLH